MREKDLNSTKSTLTSGIIMCWNKIDTREGSERGTAYWDQKWGTRRIQIQNREVKSLDQEFPSQPKLELIKQNLGLTWDKVDCVFTSSMIPTILANQRHDQLGMYSTKDWQWVRDNIGFYTSYCRKGKWRDSIVDALLPHKLLFNSLMLLNIARIANAVQCHN